LQGEPVSKHERAQTFFVTGSLNRLFALVRRQAADAMKNLLMKDIVGNVMAATDEYGSVGGSAALFFFMPIKIDIFF
jgi:hypothetical protein